MLPAVDAMPPSIDAMASAEGAMPTVAGSMLCRNECRAVHKRFYAFRSRCNIVQRGVYFSNYREYLYCRGYCNDKYREYIISKKFWKDVFACGLVVKAMRYTFAKQANLVSLRGCGSLEVRQGKNCLHRLYYE
jgi:hypothetical protein